MENTSHCKNVKNDFITDGAIDICFSMQILRQIQILVTDLCAMHSMGIPNEILAIDELIAARVCLFRLFLLKYKYIY